MANQKKAVGRPSGYLSDYARMAYKFCLLGATDADLARSFEIGETTLDRWKVAHPEFRAAIKNGREIADANVARSLYRRANGFSKRIEKIFCNQGDVTRVQTREYFPPDTAAAFIWLKNRQREKWKDRHEVGAGDDLKKLIVGWTEAAQRLSLSGQVIAENGREQKEVSH